VVDYAPSRWRASVIPAVIRLRMTSRSNTAITAGRPAKARPCRRREGPRAFVSETHPTLAAVRSRYVVMKSTTMVCGARGNLLDGVCHRPVPLGGKLAQGTDLPGKNVLVMGRHTGIRGDAHG
jgi:hypothetical protein